MAKIKNEVMSLKAMEEQMLADAEHAKASLGAVGGNFISIQQDKTFVHKEETIGKTLLGIIMAFNHLNAYYASAYDPHTPTTPNCFAISPDGEAMAPHTDAPEPQNEWCDGCPKNAWGSADARNSSAKACKNTYRLAVMGYNPADISAGDLAILSVPPTSMKVVNRYIRGLANKLGKPPMGVVTTFSFDKNFDYPVLALTADILLDKPSDYARLIARKTEAEELIAEPFDKSSFEPSKGRAKKKTTRAKKRTTKSKFA